MLRQELLQWLTPPATASPGPHCYPLPPTALSTVLPTVSPLAQLTVSH